MILSGYSSRQEKVKRIEINQLEQSKTDDKIEEKVSPYSTFKIISTLTRLHNDIIKVEISTMNYNGTRYQNPEWNENLTLQKAFQTSCIWYFHQIINSVGEEVKKELSELKVSMTARVSKY